MPRLFLIVFRYSQPLLIKRSIKYVTTASAGTSSTYGYWLIVSAVAIYVGLAVRFGSLFGSRSALTNS